MSDKDKKYLFDVLTACDEISSFISGKTRQDYKADALLRRGVERDLEIIGEALSRLREMEPSAATHSGH